MPRRHVVRLELWFGHAFGDLRVTDNGRGFDPDEAGLHARRSLGPANMKERADRSARSSGLPAAPGPHENRDRRAHARRAAVCHERNPLCGCSASTITGSSAKALSAILGRQPDMEVVAQAATGEQAVELFRQHRPDVTLMDLQLPNDERPRRDSGDPAGGPRRPIIVLTMYHGEEDIFWALEAGAASYLLKDSISDDLATMIRDVSGAAADSAEHRGGARSPGDAVAPERGEIEVVQLIGHGHRNKEIATALHITEDTAKVHVRPSFEKLDVNDRTAAVRDGAAPRHHPPRLKRAVEPSRFTLGCADFSRQMRGQEAAINTK